MAEYVILVGQFYIDRQIIHRRHPIDERKNSSDARPFLLFLHRIVSEISQMP